MIAQVMDMIRNASHGAHRPLPSAKVRWHQRFRDRFKVNGDRARYFHETH